MHARSRLLISLAVALPLTASPLIAQERPSWARPPDPNASHVRLIVRGDDFASTHASNVAMEEGFASGILTSASVLVTTPWLSEAAALAQAHPGWSIGLHLALTSEWDRLRWPPAAPPSQVASLVAGDGYLFHSYPQSPLSLRILQAPPYITSWDTTPIPPLALERRRQLTSAALPRAADVEAELRAQVQRATRLGIRIDYLDCHMGVACNPAIVHVLIDLAKELCLPIPEKGWMGYQPIPPPLGDDLPSRIAQFVGTLDHLKPGLYRVVMHPTLDTPEVRASDSYFGPTLARSGQMDVEVLQSDEVNAAIKRDGIELVSIRDLWDYDRCTLRGP